MNEVSKPDLDWDIIERLGSAASVAAALQTGLLAALGQASRTAEELSNVLGLEPVRTGYVLEVLVGEGFAARSGGGFVRSQRFEQVLGGLPLAADKALGLWGQLPRALLGEGPSWVMDADPETRARVYREATPNLAEMFNEPATELAQTLSPAGRVLDLGCGAGVWGLAFAQADADATVVGVDFEPVLGAFEDRVRHLGLEDRSETFAADLRTDTLPSGFDTVVLANVLRLEPPDVARGMLRRACDAVRSGGRLIVVDAIADGSELARRSVALYALQLGLRTRRGTVHDRAEVCRWLDAHGMREAPSPQLSSGPAHLGVLVSIRQ